jgi:hypothetical protein
MSQPFTIALDSLALPDHVDELAAMNADYVTVTRWVKQRGACARVCPKDCQTHVAAGELVA